jgi:nitrate/nitrite-specific signal transduction histidine kinase
MVIRDDGVGIDPEILRTGRDDHWGLSGMRERAIRIDGRLKLLSAPAAGTEVALVIAANVAFEPSATRGSRDWLARLYSRSEKE